MTYLKIVFFNLLRVLHCRLERFVVHCFIRIIRVDSGLILHVAVRCSLRKQYQEHEGLSTVPLAVDDTSVTDGVNIGVDAGCMLDFFADV